ncbi:MAG: molybdate ABC transporter substrate-binding protein [Tepidisphaerales bacterium]
MRMLVAAIICGLCLLLAAGCHRRTAPNPAPQELRILCGSSMSEPVQEIGRVFSEQHQAQVVYDMGGSETLLPKVVAGTTADIFVCHDPFEEKVKDAGKWAGSAAVGALRPVVMVRPGNPRGIRTIEDLAKPDVQIGIGDPRYSTCGQMFVDMLDKKNLRQPVMDRVKLQARTHVEIANGAIAGPLDVVVVWNYVAVMYKGRLEVVETGERYEDVRVTVVGLNQAAHPALRDAFLEMCRSPAVRQTFERHGYTPGREP